MGSPCAGLAAPYIGPIFCTGTERNVDMEIIGVVMEPVGITNRILRMKLLLKIPHHCLERALENGVGIESCTDQFVMERGRHGED